MKYVVLRAILPSGLKTMLIDKDECEDADFEPADYFVHGATNVINLGEVEITGEAEDYLDDVYESQ